MVKLRFSPAHILVVSIRLDTNGTLFFTSDQSTAEFTAVIHLSHSAATSRAVDVSSTQVLLLPSTRNGLMVLFLCPMLTANFAL